MLLLGLLSCADCTEPWPPHPEPSPARYLTVVPRELFVHVADPTRPTVAILVAFVHDQYGRNLDDHTTRFAVTAGGTAFAVASPGANPDTVILTVAPVCEAGGPPCAPAPVDGVVTATHSSSGLSFPIPIRVRYAAAGEDGVAAVAAGGGWPMYGVATGSIGTAWQSRMMRPFVSRTGFGKFDATGVIAPPNDEASGTVLSHEFALWREVDPWGPTPTDVTVPMAEAARPELRLRAYYAGDPAVFSAVRMAFDVALLAGADIISYTPIGAAVTLAHGTKQVPSVPWTDSCADLGPLLQSALAPEDHPAPGVISIYMLAFSSGPLPGERALHCGAGKLTPFPAAHAIILPQGGALASTIAHEIGHALSLGDVSWGSGFFDDNIMALTDDLSAPMRSRFTIGQAYRAALDPASFIVTSGQAKSAPLACAAVTKKCPSNTSDIHGRTP